MRYTSDMTDSQWEIIKPILQEAKYRSLEEKREQINAVFYLVKTGCQWRNLPKDFPKWKTVYSLAARRSSAYSLISRSVRSKCSVSAMASALRKNLCKFNNSDKKRYCERLEKQPLNFFTVYLNPQT